MADYVDGVNNNADADAAAPAVDTAVHEEFEGAHVLQNDDDNFVGLENDADDDDEFATAGGRLPIFANRKNRELDEHIKEKEKKIETMQIVLNDNTERVKIMKEHLKNVQQELQHTQQLVDAKRREIETESHLLSWQSERLPPAQH